MKTIEFAITLEADAAHYYREQADKFKGLPIERAFEILVKAEEQHLKLLQEYRKNKEAGISTQIADLDVKDSFYRELPDFKNDVASIPRQVDVYRKAQDMEKKSLELYSDLLKQTDDEQGRSLLTFLIGEEQKHFDLFGELMELLQKAEDWVENAEFGSRAREPY